MFTQEVPPTRAFKRTGTLNASPFLLANLPVTYRHGILPLSREILIHKITWLDSRRIKSRRCISTNSLCPFPFSGWRTSYKTEARSCSGYISEAMRWIQEVEVANSVDDLKTRNQIRGHRFPNLKMFDAKIASSLKKIIQNSNFKASGRADGSIR